MVSPTITVQFDGKPLTCRSNTSIAVALWEQGIRVLSHSPKYGRPRGLHCARGHCNSCLMRVDGVPNVRSCMTEIQEGMRIERQDAGAFYGPFLHKVIDSGETLFPVGFYFKWFTRPALLSRVFLKSLRPLAGSGRLPESTSWQDRAAAHLAEEQSPSRDWGNFDEVIVGAGLSGLLAAAEAHGRILLVDDQLELGGQRHGALQLLAKSLGPKLIEFPCLARAQQSLEQAVTDLPVDTVLNQALGSRIVAGYAPDSLVLHTGQHLVTLRTRTLTWTAGALDVLGLFPGNDLPGLWGPRALYRVLVRDSMRVSGQKVIVYGHGLDLWLAAALLHAGGAQVTVVLNQPGWPAEVGAAMSHAWQLHIGMSLASARRQGPQGLVLCFLGSENGNTPMELSCDLAVLVNRAKPVYDIPYQLGADLFLDPSQGGYVPRGASNGRFTTVLPSGLELRAIGEAAGLSPDKLFGGIGEDSRS